MARKRIEIDLAALQQIISREEQTFQGHLMHLLDHCSNLYNEQFDPVKKIYSQLIYLRIKKGELLCNYKPTKSPSKEQIQKMQQGRNKLFSIKSETTEEDDSLERILFQVNSLAGTRYILERHGDFVQLTNDEDGPCLSNRQMLIYLQGMCAVAKKTRIDPPLASEYNQAQQCA